MDQMIIRNRFVISALETSDAAITILSIIGVSYLQTNNTVIMKLMHVCKFTRDAYAGDYAR